jgi:hypothetical protein
MATFSTRTRIRTSRVLNVRLESTIKDTELPALLHNLIVDGGKFLYSKSNGHIILEVTRISNTVPLNPRGRQPDNRSRCVRSEHTLASPLCTCVAHCGTACSPSTTWACASAASWSCLDSGEGAGRREKPPRTPTLFNFYEGTTDPLRLNFRSEKKPQFSKSRKLQPRGKILRGPENEISSGLHNISSARVLRRIRH